MKQLRHIASRASLLLNIAFFRRSDTRRGRIAPVSYLSGASKTVWKMDTEA